MAPFIFIIAFINMSSKSCSSPWPLLQHAPSAPLAQVFAADRKPFHKSCINCQTRGCPNQLTVRGMHRINGLVVCSSCEQRANPPVYAPVPYKETAEDVAMKEMIRKKKEEAPKKIMAEMKQMMDVMHNRDGVHEKEVRPSVVVHKLEGLEEFCKKPQGL